MTIRRLHVSLLALMPLVASADTLGTRSLHGTYGCHVTNTSEQPTFTWVRDRFVATVRLDGAGVATGARRVVLSYHAQGMGSGTASLPVLEQTATGTYSIGADGLGVMELSWTPEFPPVLSPAHAARTVTTRDLLERCQLALAGDGFSAACEFTERYLLLGSDGEVLIDKSTALGLGPMEARLVTSPCDRRVPPASNGSSVRRPQ